MSRFKKSVERTGENLKFSGAIVISPWVYGKQFFRPPSAMIGFDVAFGFPIFVASLATTVTLVAGGIHAVGSLAVGIVDMGYSVCTDCIVEENPNHEPFSPNTQAELQPYNNQSNSYAVIKETLSIETAPINEQFSNDSEFYPEALKSNKLFNWDKQEQVLYWEEEHPKIPLLG